MADGIRTRGFTSFDAAMKQLGGKISFKVSGKAANFSMTPVLKAAKGKAPVADEDGGTLRDSIKKKVIRNKGSATVVGIVGIAKGFLSPRRVGRRNPRIYAHLVEFGGIWKARDGTTTNRPARPFIRPAWVSNQTNVAQRYGKKFGKELANEVKKLPSRRGLR